MDRIRTITRLAKRSAVLKSMTLLLALTAPVLLFRAQVWPWGLTASLIRRLAVCHDHATFVLLNRIMQLNQPDIAYEAVEALEGRKDSQFDLELIESVRLLPRDNRWAAYRMLRHYQTEPVLNFLRCALEEELRHSRGKEFFDDRNHFYIVGSIEAFGLKPQEATAPTGTMREVWAD